MIMVTTPLNPPYVDRFYTEKNDIHWLVMYAYREE